MEDEQQSTLKKKIQILFQLGKWADVAKLCESYGEKYGRDEEIEQIRYKSQRHMGGPAPAARSGAEGNAVRPDSKAGPLGMAGAETVITDPTIPLIPPEKAEAFPAAYEEKLAYDSSPEAEDLDVGDPFAEDGLVITDPFADVKPEFSLAPEQPPVVISEPGAEAGPAIFGADELDMERRGTDRSDRQEEDGETDFESIGAMTLDAEPDLGTPGPDAKPRPEPQFETRPDPRPEARRETAATMFTVPEEKAPGDLFRSLGGRSEQDEPSRASRAVPAGMADEDEKPRRPTSPLPEMLDQKAPAQKKAIRFKMVLLVVLPLVAAVALWLALSGKLDISGSAEAPAVTRPMVTVPAVKRPRPAKKAAPPALSPQAIEQEKEFAEKLRRAEELNRQGDLIKAWAVLLEAKSIKVTEPLLLLEEQLSQKMREAEAQARKQTEIVLNTQEMENQAFARAESEGTIIAWRGFIASYPDGELALRAGRRIAALEKKALEISQQQLLVRIQRSQKVRLRSSFLNMSQADIAAMTRQGGRVPAQFEAHEHGGETVMLDLATGLMWTLWKKPMAFDKARWWANRVTAGYGSWRLPTTEEALSLLQIDRNLYSGLAALAVWTGDAVSDQPRTVWALRLPAGEFVAAPHAQMLYVWAVRRAGK
jgi:hypothetical protein